MIKSNKIKLIISFIISIFFSISIYASLNINISEPSINGLYFVNSIGELNISTNLLTNCSYNINSGSNISFNTSNSSLHYKSNLNITSYSQGSNTINISCIDSNNASISNTSSRSFIKDTSSPSTSDNAPFGWQTNIFNLTLNASDLYSGVFYTTYMYDFGSWINGTLIPITTTGTHFISYYSIDNLNLIESTTNITVSLDINNPLTLDDVLLGWQASVYNITLNASDIGSGISYTTYRMNSGNWTNSSIIPILNEGNNTIDYYSVDIAGNIETTNTIFAGLDINLPNTTDNSPSYNWQNAPFNISLNASDLGSGINYTTYSLNNGSFVNGTTIIVSSEGNNSLNYYSVDNANNFEINNIIYLALDLTKPSSNHTAPSIWQTIPFNITLNASDNLSGISYISYSLNNGAWINESNLTTILNTSNISKSINILINISGNHSIDYYSVDGAGNNNNITNISVILDLIDPITSDNAPIAWQTNSFNITLNTSDNLSGISSTYYRINFGSWINSSLIEITSSGVFNIDYYSVDNAGNIETINSVTVLLDLNDPITVHNTSLNWQTIPLNVTLNASDSISGIENTTYRLNLGNWTNSSIIPILNSGNHSINYYSIDIAGNIESLNSIFILLDLDFPYINHNAPIAWQTNPFNITINATDNLSGIEYITYRINNASWINATLINWMNITNQTNGTRGINIIINTSGIYDIDYYTSDIAGNILATNNFTVKLDLDIPYTIDTAPIGWQKTSFNIALSSNDNTSGVLYTSYQIDNSSLINGTVVPISNPGSHNINYFAVDLAGNIETINTVNASLDNVLPITNDNNPSGWQNLPFNITLNAIDNLSGISYISYRLNNGTWFNSTNGINISINVSGNHSLEYFAVDNVLNIGVKNTVYAALDLIAPNTSDDISIIWQSTAFVVSLSPSDTLSGINITSYKIDNGSWINGTSIPINTLGYHNITYFSIDNAGNIENNNLVNVGLDSSKPNTSDNAPITWQNTQFNISLTAIDDASGVNYTNYRIDGGPWINSTNIIVNISGNYTIEYHSVDNLAKIESINLINVLLDLIPANTSNNISSLKSWYITPFNITLNASDIGSGINYTSYRINNGTWINSSYINLSMINITNETSILTNIHINSSSNYSIEYRSFDIAANIETSKFLIFGLDFLAPNTSNNAPIGWQNLPYNISLNSSDDLSGINYTRYRVISNTVINGELIINSSNYGPWINSFSINSNNSNNSSNSSNSSINLNLLTNILINNSGNYTLEYKSFDVAGNIEILKNLTNLLDIIAPNTSNNAPIGWQNLPYNITLNSSDIGLGVNYTSYRINNGTWINNTIVNITNPYIIVNINSTGNITLEYYSVDLLGNKESKKISLSALDIISPTTIDNAPSSLQNLIFNITLNASDIGSGIDYTTYRINNGTWINGTIVLINESGFNKLDYYSVDLLGNTEIINSIQVYLDLNTSNIISLNTISPTSYSFNKSYYFNLSLNTNYDILNISLSFNGTVYYMSNISTNYYYTLNNLNPGIYNFTYIINTISNNTYNTSSETLEIISLDNNTIIGELESINISSNQSKIIIPKFSPLKSINITLNSSLNLSEDLDFYLNFSSILDSINNNLSLNNALNITRYINSIRYSIDFSENTNFNFESNWDGIFKIIKPLNLSKLSNLTNLTYTVSSGTLNSVLSLGSETGLRINLTKPAKIRIPGMSGKSGAWNSNSNNISIFTKITTICNSLVNPSNINSISNQECYINDGSDLIIWTYHFTDFAAYTPDPVPVTPTPSSSSGSTSSSSSSSSSSETYVAIIDEDGDELILDTTSDSISINADNNIKTLKFEAIQSQKLSLELNTNDDDDNNKNTNLFEFSYLGKINAIKLKNIEYLDSKITIIFRDNIDEIFSLNESETQYLDSNSNGENDIKVWFKFRDSTSINLYVSGIFNNGDEELSALNLNELNKLNNENNIANNLNNLDDDKLLNQIIQENSNDDSTSSIQEEKSITWYWHALGIIIIIIILGLIFVSYRYYKNSSEEIESDIIQSIDNTDNNNNNIVNNKNIANNMDDKSSDATTTIENNIDTKNTINKNMSDMKTHLINSVIDEAIVKTNEKISPEKDEDHSMHKYLKKRVEQIEELEFKNSDYKDDYSDEN